MLSSSLKNNHTTDSQCTEEEIALLNLKLKILIIWGKLNDQRWKQHDDDVSSKLSNCTTLSARVTTLEETMYTRACRIFGYLPTPKRNLAGLTCSIKHCKDVIKEKNILLEQIKSVSTLEQRQGLRQLLIVFQTKIKAFHKSEKSRKCCRQIKKAKTSFKINPYNAGQTLFDPKNYTTLKVDAHLLDSHKSSFLQDKFYDVPLGELEGLPAHPPLQKIFSKSAFSQDDFLTISLKQRNSSALGINAIPCKVYQKCAKLSKYLFKIF